MKAAAPGNTSPFQTSKAERTTYGLFFVGQNFFYIMVVSFLQVFLTDTGITAAAVAAIFLVAKVWDAVNDPIFGVIIDRSKPKKGKFLPWVRASIVPICLTTILMFAMPGTLSLTVKIVWSMIAYVLWDLTYTLLIAASSIPMIILPFFVPALVKKYGKFKLYLAMVIWFVLSSVLVYAVGYANFGLLMISLLVRGIGNMLSKPMTAMMTAVIVQPRVG